MKAIGGYFELELNIGKEYHDQAIRLNTGKNAFEYILRSHNYSKVILPYYICDTMLEPLLKTGISYEFYSIDESLYPKLEFSKWKNHDVLLYVNYFGLCDKHVKRIAKESINLIIDNSQSFFSLPIKGISTLYSPRKFFGVPDGAYLYTGKRIKSGLPRDISANRMSHLIQRIENGAESGYNLFKINDDSLKNQPIKQMSALTQRLLQNIDYEKVKITRRENFLFLHSQLKGWNTFKFDQSAMDVPMVYPFQTDNRSLRDYLVKNRVYVAQYWPNVLEWTNDGMLENKLTNEIVPLPVDQRYTLEDMGIIVSMISKFMG
jgi:hypothetical protein